MKWAGRESEAFVSDRPDESSLNAQDVVRIPMQRSMCTDRFFEPVHSAALPIGCAELYGAIDELDRVLQKGLPKWLRIAPVALIVFACMLWCFSLFAFIVVDENPQAHFFAGSAVGALVMIVGCFLMRHSFQQEHDAILALQGKVSELNQRFAPKGINFHLSESPVLHFTVGNNNVPISDFTLEVKAAQPQKVQASPSAPGVVVELSQLRS